MSIDLEAEFANAILTARRTRFSFPLSRRVQWGVSAVAYYGNDRHLYEPMPPDGQVAFIAPVVEDGELIDLCAIEANSRHVGTRLGLGRGLGLDAVDEARMGGELRLVGDALSWLRQPVDAVYLFRLGDVQTALDGVRQFTCNSIELAERVVSLLPPSQRDRVVLDG